MLKWTVEKTGVTNGIYRYKVMAGKKLVFRGEYRQCELAAAAHNAILDMAFDSPGNVS